MSSRRKRLLKMKKLRNKSMLARSKVIEKNIHFQTPVPGGEEWQRLEVPSVIVRSLAEMGFTSPTEIQKKSIPPAIKDKCDIIGAAETGSGKTLAFGIPILHYILTNLPDLIVDTKTPVTMDTRLATDKQYNDEGSGEIIDLNEVVLSRQFSETGKEEISCQDDFDDEEFLAKRKKVFDETGDNTEQRGLVTYQDNIPDDIFQRMIGREQLQIDYHIVDTVPGLIALILTPTRELALQVKSHIEAAAKFTNIKICAVVGGMSSQKQERLLKLRPQIVIATPGRLWKVMKEEGNPHLNALDQLQYLVLDEADRMVEHGHFHELSLILERISFVKPPGSYQTMVFSATLTLPRRKTSRKRKSVGSMSGEQSIDNLISKAGLAENATIIDLTRKEGTVERLTESKIVCSLEDKDLYLYYCLLVSTGRTLVFSNSLDCLYRLKSLLETLKLHPLPLHARMQQRQRLKNLDRFIADPNGLLVASDVAARGLDIPQVQHIIHYQVPKSSEVYVHRSGRTARGREAQGSSVMLIGPDDLQAYKNICRTLNREEELPNFPIDLSLLKPLRARIKIAKKIDIEDHKLRKTTRDQNWFERTAKAMDIILDEDMMEISGGGEMELKARKDKLRAWRTELNHLLAQEVVPHHVSLRFPSVELLQEQKTKLSNRFNQLKYTK